MINVIYNYIIQYLIMYIIKLWRICQTIVILPEKRVQRTFSNQIMVKIWMEFWKSENFMDVGYSHLWEYLWENGEIGRKYLMLHISYSCLKYGAGMGEDWLLQLMASSPFIFFLASILLSSFLSYFFSFRLLLLLLFLISLVFPITSLYSPNHFCPILSSRFNYFSYLSFCFLSSF